MFLISQLVIIPEDISERLLIFPESSISHKGVFISSGRAGPVSRLRNTISGTFKWRFHQEDPRCPKCKVKPGANWQENLKYLF